MRIDVTSVRWVLPSAFALAGAVFSWPAPVQAATPYKACMAKANSTLDMQDCQSAAVADVDARLAAALAYALKHLPPDQADKLRASQRRWVVFRLGDCRVYYGQSTGTIATVQGGECMIERGEERIKEVRGFTEQ